jgi:ABC-type multidrug transport system fused ATPase/permease subunit
MNGMADIIPPVPAHDGLAALLAPASASSGWLLAFTLLIVLALLVSAWLMRRRLLTCLRLAQAQRSLRAGRVDVVEKLLRQHYELAQLHPAKPPLGVDAACWRALIEGLHEIRFGTNAIAPSVLSHLLIDVFTPSPLAGKGAKPVQPSQAQDDGTRP